MKSATQVKALDGVLFCTTVSNMLDTPSQYPQNNAHPYPPMSNILYRRPVNDMNATAAHQPPIVHTHRRPGQITARDIFTNRKRDAERTTPPTHYGTPRPMLDELRLNNITAGRTHE